MKGFRRLVNLLVYRFSMSNDELMRCQKDRRSMDEFRRKINDCQHRIELHERTGGNCSSNGGAGVMFTFSSYSLVMYSQVKIDPELSSNVIDMQSWKNQGKQSVTCMNSAR